MLRKTSVGLCAGCARVFMIIPCLCSFRSGAPHVPRTHGSRAVHMHGPHMLHRHAARTPMPPHAERMPPKCRLSRAGHIPLKCRPRACNWDIPPELGEGFSPHEASGGTTFVSDGHIAFAPRDDIGNESQAARGKTARESSTRRRSGVRNGCRRADC